MNIYFFFLNGIIILICFYFVIYFADKLNKESNANLHDFLRERKWVKLCIVLFGIMSFLLLIAHIVLSIIQCPSGNRK